MIERFKSSSIVFHPVASNSIVGRDGSHFGSHSGSQTGSQVRLSKGQCNPVSRFFKELFVMPVESSAYIVMIIRGRWFCPNLRMLIPASVLYEGAGTMRSLSSGKIMFFHKNMERNLKSYRKMLLF